MKEVLPGIYLMTLTLSGFNPDSVNTYIIKTPDGLVSIDTGWDSPPAVQSMQEQLAEIGATTADIHQVIATHCHIDHMGLVPRLKRENNIQFYMHEKEIDLIKIRFTEVDNFIPMTNEFLQTHGVPVEELTPPEFILPIPPDLYKVRPDVLLHGGEEIPVGQYTLKVINIPGHTLGHIGLYEPDHKFIFSGDFILPTISTNAAMHVQHIPFPLQQYLESLQTLRKLDIDLILPGHDQPFTGHRKRIDELIQNHEAKAAQIYKIFADGQPRTAYEVSRIMAWSSRTQTDIWNRLTGWDKRFAILQAIAHLESLRYHEKLTLTVRSGINYYFLR
jgi:glyoxylase-like metal-dependent hydrolase (beta-lactamase superfamily II)